MTLPGFELQDNPGNERADIVGSGTSAPTVLLRDFAYSYRVWITLIKLSYASLQHPKNTADIHQGEKVMRWVATFDTAGFREELFSVTHAFTRRGSLWVGLLRPLFGWFLAPLFGRFLAPLFGRSLAPLFGRFLAW
jgi:hypothetical protein